MAGHRVGRTADGRHVPIDHPDAAYLAYSEHDRVPPEVLSELKAAEGKQAKEAAAPRDKAVKKAANKKSRTSDGARR